MHLDQLCIIHFCIILFILTASYIAIILLIATQMCVFS